MKKIGLILCLTAIMVFTSVIGVFAAEPTLKIVETYPKDRQDNTTVENMSVKINFNNPVGGEKYRETNNEAFTIKDNKGNVIKTKVVYNPKDKHQAMVLADTLKSKTKIKDDTEYILYISKNFTDDEGNTLTKDEKVRFKTQNQKRNTSIYFVMMIVMFGGMFFFMSRSMKHNAEKEQEEKEYKVNPYKEAKRTGKSVEEIVEKTERERAKKQAKAAKKASKNKNDIEIEEEYLSEGHYRVKRPHAIVEAGSTYITGRKAEAEAKAAREEKWAKAAKNKKKRR